MRLNIKSSLFFLMLSSIHLSAQVLHTENFNVILDTTQVLKGEFNPFLRFRNLKK